MVTPPRKDQNTHSSHGYICKTIGTYARVSPVITLSRQVPRAFRPYRTGASSAVWYSTAIGLGPLIIPDEGISKREEESHRPPVSTVREFATSALCCNLHPLTDPHSPSQTNFFMYKFHWTTMNSSYILLWPIEGQEQLFLAFCPRTSPERLQSTSPSAQSSDES